MFWNANNKKEDWVSWHSISLYVPKVFSFNMSFVLNFAQVALPITFSFVTSFAQSFIEFWGRHTKHSSIQKYETLKKERMWCLSHLFVAMQKGVWSFSLSIPRMETQGLELRGLFSLCIYKANTLQFGKPRRVQGFFFPTPFIVWKLAIW